MTYRQETDKRKILDQVLPGLKPISQAPRSVMDFPEALKLRGAELDAFEDRVKAEDAARDYKAVDDKGNVFVMKNPWSTKQELPAQLMRGCVHKLCETSVVPHVFAIRLSRPVLKMTHAEAVEAAKHNTAANIAACQEQDQW